MPRILKEADAWGDLIALVAVLRGATTVSARELAPDPFVTMRFDIWVIVRFLHVASAMVWVGGQLTLSLLVRPVAARIFDEPTRVDLVTRLGSRFGRLATFALIPVFLASGLALVFHRGVTLELLSTPGYGATLGVKIVLALASFAIVGIHGFVASRSSARTSRLVGIIGLAVSLIVVLLAVSLVP